MSIRGHAGSNTLVDIVVFENEDDNVRGGAMVTGSVVSERIPASMHASKPIQAIIQQGIEYYPTWIISFRAAHVKDIKELDGFRVVGPSHHESLNDYFVIVARDPSTIPNNQSRAHVRFWIQRKRWATNANLVPG